MNNEIDKMYNKLKEGLMKNKASGVTIHKGGDVDIASHVPYGIPTGIPEIDILIRGGYPAGKIIELYGKPMCGKTTMALHAVRQVQKMNGLILWVDAEQSWDNDRAIQLGIKLDEILIASSDTIEATFKTMEMLIDNLEENNNRPILFVVDSITGVPTESESDGYIDKEIRVGQEARQIRRGVKTLVSKLAKHKATILFINHAIAKIGSFRGKQTQSAGGNAIKFFSALRLLFINIGTLKGKDALGKFDKDIRVGQKIKVELEKLKGSALWELFIDDLNLRNDIGFDHNLSLLNAGVKTGWITRPNQLIYKLGEKHQFKKFEWLDLIESLGGYDTVYNMWKTHAIENGKLTLWESNQ